MSRIWYISTTIVRPTSYALSRTLDIFYPLAVTEIKDKTLSCFSINCNGDGAQFVHAAADGDIVSNFFSMNEILNYEGVSKPLLAVQVTELVDGIFIGCTMNHSVVDGSSFWHFFNTWVFHFSKEKIAHLKSKANAEMGTNNISSLQALMAHHWRAITRCGHLNPDQVISYRVAVGLRQKLKAPLPKEYLGNALQGVSVKSTACELLQHGLGWAALHINKTIASLTAEEVKKILKDWEKAPSASITSSVSLLIGSSPRFNVYGNDFGWGRPVAVWIDFEVCLLPETVHAMAEDAEFLEAVAT
ncbi:hypothetical protein D8674_020102 [Pyrus ussuriensis x Pyrus communis]|uniref:Acetyltransferase n=1 Tax=Pyrus ussuriensis x Pyrus communis TaxID=2448454 RepID=A0A5N5HT03_9ROSA|nr:hypothetical protein D8674_020102 [Pyrus ussuriensis x Pyrus communis]